MGRITSTGFDWLLSLPLFLVLFGVLSRIIHSFFICIFSFFFFYFQMKFKIILSLRKPVTDILKRDLSWTCGHVPQGSWKTSYLNQVLNSDHLWRNADIIYSFKRVFCADQKVKEVESLLTTKCFPFIVVSVIFWQRLIYKASGP